MSSSKSLAGSANKVSMGKSQSCKKDRRTTIEIFDLETLDITAPVQMVAHYEKGKYISFTVNKSAGIRRNQVTGQNAALSALFID